MAYEQWELTLTSIQNRFCCRKVLCRIRLACCFLRYPLEAMKNNEITAQGKSIRNLLRSSALVELSLDIVCKIHSEF